MSKRPHVPDSHEARPRLERRASTTATATFASRWQSKFTDGFYRPTHSGLTASSVALGTYLGDSDDATDAAYHEAIALALASGVNVIDTAINYRCQRSERIVGAVLRDAMRDGVLARDEVIVCTKAGYLPLDGSPPQSRDAYDAYVRREYFDRGVLASGDLVGGGHAIAPDFLLDQLERSLRNLGLESVDYFYIHNPEQQLAAIGPAELATRLRSAFAVLEGCVSRGAIGAYGCATWNGLRLPAGSQGHLSLYELVGIARQVAGEAHHFRIVQLPINLTMSEAVRVSTQRDARGRLVHVVDAAADLGIDLVASAPLLQGQLTRDLPTQLHELFPGKTDAGRALAFARSWPRVVSAAVGMRQAAHVEENLASCRPAQA